MRAISLLGFHLVVQDVKPKFDRLPLAWRSHVAILFIARGLRGFGDGFAVVVLPAYLSALGYSPAEIGVLATVSLLGSALLTLAVGFLAPRHELRSMLLVGAGLMALTGVTFAGFPDFNHVAFVMIVGFVGTVIPSSGDVGVMVPLEHAMLAHEVSDAERTRTFARYSLTGALSIAAGALAAAVPDFLVTTGIGRIASFQAMFLFYAGLGLASAALYRCLPRARAEAPRPAAPLGPSRGIVYKLAALFSLDSFAGGFLVQSLLALWLFERFDLSLKAASLFFFWSSVLTAFSYPVAARLSRRIGLVNTMVFTHIPASVCLILAAFSPNLAIALTLLLARSALSQMDVPARTSYVMAVVTPAERTAAASVTAVPRSLASAVSPALTGFLLATSFAGLPLVACGTLKIVYDLALLFSFRHVKPPEERAPPRAGGP
jgi:MFS family permease